MVEEFAGRSSLLQRVDIADVAKSLGGGVGEKGKVVGMDIHPGNLVLSRVEVGRDAHEAVIAPRGPQTLEGLLRGSMVGLVDAELVKPRLSLGGQALLENVEREDNLVAICAGRLENRNVETTVGAQPDLRACTPWAIGHSCTGGEILKLARLLFTHFGEEVDAAIGLEVEGTGALRLALQCASCSSC